MTTALDQQTTSAETTVLYPTKTRNPSTKIVPATPETRPNALTLIARAKARNWRRTYNPHAPESSLIFRKFTNGRVQIDFTTNGAISRITTTVGERPYTGADRLGFALGYLV